MLFIFADWSKLYLKARHFVTQEFKLRHVERIREWNMNKGYMIREDIEFMDKVFLLLKQTCMCCTQRGLSPCLLERTNKVTGIAKRNELCIILHF